MVKVREAIVVEGRYDKNTLAQIVDAPIFTTEGFGIFKNREQLALLRQVAERRGLIILTDSDGAGFVIRNFLKGTIPEKNLKQAYIPDVSGKEPRKRTPGKEGKLGVEGLRPEVLVQALKNAGATFDEDAEASFGKITKADFVELGLSGGQKSGEKRLELARQCNLPEHMSANALLQALNLILTKEDLVALVSSLEKKHG